VDEAIGYAPLPCTKAELMRYVRRVKGDGTKTEVSVMKPLYNAELIHGIVECIKRRETGVSSRRSNGAIQNLSAPLDSTKKTISRRFR